ncbi:hypothetical protein B4N84_15400 [Flavobacterium sp. IR1]|nr:hypothetical protein B4N84_15400 [Flavobacterium sp. IR1]
MRKSVGEVDLTCRTDGSVWIYDNRKNNASFMVNDSDDVCYNDSVGNYMTSSPRYISINFEHFQLKNYGDAIRKSDGTRMIMMRKEDIQDIANKTFYDEGQVHVIDFLTFSVNEPK